MRHFNISYTAGLMTRPIRIEYPGAVYRVICRAITARRFSATIRELRDRIESDKRLKKRLIEIEASLLS